jgi:pimeloyl-ACP methyl ester carboxylesterase
MRTYTVTGGGGIRLHVEEAGNPDGQPVLFLHGFSQCRLAWGKQLASDLADDLRLVAPDLRGHGLSDKPRDAYGDPRLWADDIHAVIEALGLERPILVGWSYGGVVIGDYLRAYGEERLGGIHLVGAATKLGSEAALAVIGPDFLALVPAFFSTDAEESVRGLEAFVRLCVHGEPAPQDLYFMLGYNAVVPPHVRQGLLSRALDNDDVLARLSRPVLIAHAEADRVVLRAAAEQHARTIPHARTSYYPGVGHALFWEDAERFNRELREFAGQVRTGAPA